jgi:hypothetical protein
MPGSFTGIRPTFPATSLTRTRRIVARSRSRSTIGGSRFAPVRDAGGVAFVTTRPQPPAFVRVVTNHGSEAQENERERERAANQHKHSCHRRRYRN